MSDHDTRPGQEGPPDQTQKLVLPLTSGTPSPDQAVTLPTGEARQGGTPGNPLPPPRSWGWKLALALGGAVVLAGLVLLLSSPGPAAHPAKAQAVAPEAEVPGPARAYLDQAKAGDANAMRMLGAMYYYGLDVPPDRDKGLYWYRRAAEAGSEMARTELSRLEGAAGK
jgi:TPR repeat protein